MKSFDEVVYCKTQEERDAIIDWVDTFFVQEGIHTFKTYFTKCANACVKFHSIDDLKYAFKEFYENNPQYDKIITFQQFKDKYMSASEVNSQSPSESVKVKSDGGSSDYYKITLTNKAGESIEVEMGDIIRQAFNNDFDLGNIVKACRRIAEAKQGRGKAGVDIAYDANKIIYFANEIKDWDK